MKRHLSFLLLSLLALLAACAPVIQLEGPTPQPPTPPAEPEMPPTPIVTIAPTKVATETITSAQIDYNGISFAYDPVLFGPPQMGAVAPTAAGGLFEQPSPAFTWIGFEWPEVQRYDDLRWSMFRDPQITVFDANGFGSFAPADEQARTKIAWFKEMLTERPTTFPAEGVPVLPPINAAQMMQAQVEWLDFGHISGVRFVTGFSQEAVPVTNERLIYLFYGLTDDGLYGVTAVFPLRATGLSDSFTLSDAEFIAFMENYEAEMAAVTQQLNQTADADFYPHLSQLDALVQTITIAPSKNDLELLLLDVSNYEVIAETDVFSTPAGTEAIGHLDEGAAVVTNAVSLDNRWIRILCADGTTGNCWVPIETVSIDTGDPVFYTGGMPAVGSVAQIAALGRNKIYTGPGETYTLAGEMMVGEVVAVYGADETGQWYNIDCLRGLGESCWVTADPAVNEPTGFYAGDGWQDISSEYVSFRLPEKWQPLALELNGGSVLADWQLGIPNVTSDQFIGFSGVLFDNLKPADVVSEDELLIGGRPGFKWVRQGEGYISYDYYTTPTDAAQTAGAGSFGLHVTVADADPELEAILDMVANSVAFSR